MVAFVSGEWRFRLVREAVQDAIVFANAPHLVKPLQTIPIFKRFSGRLNAPLKFFRLLNRPQNVVHWLLRLDDDIRCIHWEKSHVPKHHFLSRTESLAKWKQLNRKLSTQPPIRRRDPEPRTNSDELVLDAEAENPKHMR